MKRAQSNHVIRWDSAGSKRGKNSQARIMIELDQSVMQSGSWGKLTARTVGKPLAAIDLFRLSILYSQCRSCDDTEVVWTFVAFYYKDCVRAWKYPTLKENTPQGIVAWSVLGTQNRQAEKVYYNNQSSPNVSFVVQPFLWWLIASKIQPHCSKWKWM